MKYECELAIASREIACSITASDFFVCDLGSDRVVCCSCQLREDLISYSCYLEIKSSDMDVDLPVTLQQATKGLMFVAASWCRRSKATIISRPRKWTIQISL